MKVKCYYRVVEDAPICEGTYDYDTGLIDGVKSEHFCVISTKVRLELINHSLILLI